MKKIIINKDELYKFYWRDKKSLKDIASIFNVDKRTISRKMKKFNISTRTISEGTKLKVKYGSDNYMYGKTGKNNPNYKEERHLKHYCKNKDCNNEISYKVFRYDSGLCKHCAAIESWENNEGRRKQASIKMKERHDSNFEEMSEEHKLKISVALMGVKRKSFSKETKRKMSLTRGGTGISYENSEYPEEFRKIRPKILKRDNYNCQNCGMTQEEHFAIYGRDIEVHHIDYDKQNNREENLITLCKQCNLRANFNRDYWFAYYSYIMENLK